MVTARIFVWPAQGMTASVDSIGMLVGPGNRLPVALELAREHRARYLLSREAGGLRRAVSSTDTGCEAHLLRSGPAQHPR
jgi:hypothetical protein